MKTLPLFLVKMLAAPPHTGIHNWLFCVARHLHAHMTAVEIITLLEDRVRNCRRRVSRKEITDAMKASYECAWQPPGSAATVQATTKWPDVNHNLRELVIQQNGGLADLQKLSTPRLEGSASYSDRIIDRLFAGEPLLCCGKSNSIFETRPREDWRGQLAGLALIVPSPMTAVWGTTKDGKPSQHTLSNTGNRRFLICEFDSGTEDEQGGLLMHLGQYTPLVCVVHSGGKSLHGWFYVEGHPEEKVKKFFRYAVSLGADRAMWTPSQFVRMPDGKRDNGNKQVVFYLNYKPMEKLNE